MHLYIDAKNGFLVGAAQRRRQAGAGSRAGQKSHVIVRTRGPMHYDLTKEQARFDIPTAKSGVEPAPTEQVLVLREHKVEPQRHHDRSVDLRQPDAAVSQEGEWAAGAGPKDPLAGDKEIESALATGAAGTRSDPDHGHRETRSLRQRAVVRLRHGHGRDRSTILKGTPLHALRDGNMIEALELHLFGPDKNGNGQHTFAKGPGKIDLLSKAVDLGLAEATKDGDGKDAKPMNPRRRQAAPHHARPVERQPHLDQGPDGDRIFDLLTFTGDAVFIDDEHKQSLSGQRLQVWLEQTNGPAGSSSSPAARARQKPHKVEAFERVTVQSPEMQIEKCHHLMVVFKEEPAKDDFLPNPGTLPMPLAPAGKDVRSPQPLPMAPVVELKRRCRRSKCPMSSCRPMRKRSRRTRRRWQAVRRG